MLHAASTTSAAHGRRGRHQWASKALAGYMLPMLAHNQRKLTLDLPSPFMWKFKTQSTALEKRQWEFKTQSRALEEHRWEFKTQSGGHQCWLTIGWISWPSHPSPALFLFPYWVMSGAHQDSSPLHTLSPTRNPKPLQTPRPPLPLRSHAPSPLNTSPRASASVLPCS